MNATKKKLLFSGLKPITVKVGIKYARFLVGVAHCSILVPVDYS
jgi:hypothetical protein